MTNRVYYRGPRQSDTAPIEAALAVSIDQVILDTLLAFEQNFTGRKDLGITQYLFSIVGPTTAANESIKFYQQNNEIKLEARALGSTAVTVVLNGAIVASATTLVGSIFPFLAGSAVVAVAGRALLDAKFQLIYDQVVGNFVYDNVDWIFGTVDYDIQLVDRSLTNHGQIAGGAFYRNGLDSQTPLDAAKDVVKVAATQNEFLVGARAGQLVNVIVGASQQREKQFVTLPDDILVKTGRAIQVGTSVAENWVGKDAGGASKANKLLISDVTSTELSVAEVGSSLFIETADKREQKYSTLVPVENVYVDGNNHGGSDSTKPLLFLGSTSTDFSMFGHSAATNIMIGLEGGDRIEAGSKNDFLYGDFVSRPEDDNKDGTDTIRANGGDDYVVGGLFADTIFGGDGVDYIIGDYEDKVRPLDGNDIIDGGAKSDTIWGGGGNDIIRGGDGKDFLWGTGSALTAIDETKDKDTLYGGKERDELYGQLGDDTLYGGEGGDLLEGDKGKDKLYHNEAGLEDDGVKDGLLGGVGFDEYYVGNLDYISDSDGEGRIQLNGLWLELGCLKDDGDGNDATLLAVGKMGEVYRYDGSRVLTVTYNGAKITIDYWTPEKNLSIRFEDCPPSGNYIDLRKPDNDGQRQAPRDETPMGLVSLEKLQNLDNLGREQTTAALAAVIKEADDVPEYPTYGGNQRFEFSDRRSVVGTSNEGDILLLGNVGYAVDLSDQQADEYLTSFDGIFEDEDRTGFVDFGGGNDLSLIENAVGDVRGGRGSDVIVALNAALGSEVVPPEVAQAQAQAQSQAQPSPASENLVP